LQFATREADFETLRKQADAMREFGAKREVKTAAECLALEPALEHAEEPVVGGIYDPHDESGDAFKFTSELAERARARGVTFRGNRTVDAIEHAGDRVEGVRAGGEQIRADAYVVCL